MNRKIIYIILILLVVPFRGHAASFNDVESDSLDTADAGTLDIELRSDQGNFVVDAEELYAGDKVARSIYVSNLGTADIQYLMNYSYDSGEEDLCDEMNLKVYYYWYDQDQAHPGDHSHRNEDLLYSGLLKDFSDVASPTFEEYHDNAFYDSNEQMYYFELELPSSAPYSISSKTCEFDIDVFAWQDSLANPSDGFWDEESISNTIGTADWPPETPTGLHILDYKDRDLGCGGTTSNRTITVDWDDSSAFDFASFDYKIKEGTIIDSLTVSERSGQIRDEDGLYKYSIRAVDAGGYLSPWTDWCEVTLDRTIQDAEEEDVIINEVMWMGSTSSGEDEWIELYNSTNDEIKLKDWVIENAGSDLTIPDGYTIPAKGYFLISNFDEADSELSVDPDWVTTDINLDDSGVKLILKDAYGNTIDSMDDANWAVGEDGTNKKSMERNNTPSSGWHTCTDPVCNDTTYWDNEGNNYGTPKSENHSENDPSSDENMGEQEDSYIEEEDIGIEVEESLESTESV